MSIAIPQWGWNAFAGFSVLGAVTFTGLFFIGWLNASKKSFTYREYLAWSAGAFMAVSGGMVFTGRFIPAFVPETLVVEVSTVGYGYWGTILGVLLFCLGLFMPIKFDEELAKVTQ